MDSSLDWGSVSIFSVVMISFATVISLLIIFAPKKFDNSEECDRISLRIIRELKLLEMDVDTSHAVKKLRGLHPKLHNMVELCKATKNP